MEHKFFTLIPARTTIPFIRASKVTLLISMATVLGMLFLLFTRGLNYGVDFKGGTQVHVNFEKEVEVDAIRNSIRPAGFGDASVQEFGQTGKNEFLIRIAPDEMDMESFRESILASLETAVGQKPSLRFATERAYLKFDTKVELERVEESLKALKADGLMVETVSWFGSSEENEVLVRFEGVGSRLVGALKSSFGAQAFEVLQTEQVGAKVGKELRLQAIGAVLISVLVILVYIWFRFDLEFAPGAVFALIHDALFVLGVFSLFQFQFDLSIVAAVLTIVGFSINDTIVVYDRVRENLKEYRNKPFEEVVNISLNETLSRTILTSGTLFLAAIALWVWGGPITANFALAFTIGVVAGTYSTLFIASPFTIAFYHYQQKRRARG